MRQASPPRRAERQWSTARRRLWRERAHPESRPWPRASPALLLRRPEPALFLALLLASEPEGFGGRFRFSSPLAFDLEPDQRRTNRDRLADLRAEPKDFTIDRRRNLHSRLVGHHSREHRIFPHQIADLDVPFDELGLGDAFANIRELDHMLTHDQASIVSMNARPTRAGPGK